MIQDDTNDTEPTSGFDPLSTTDKEKWQLEETDGHYALVKREADTEFDARVMEGADA